MTAIIGKILKVLKLLSSHYEDLRNYILKTYRKTESKTISENLDKIFRD